MRKLACLSLFVLLMPLATIRAVSLPSAYPRIANYYLTRTLGRSDVASLARWDVVILGLDNQYTNPHIIQQLRQANPNIILLAYVLSEEFPGGYENVTDPNYPLVQLRSGIADGWWLRNTAGEKTGFWPGANMLNLTSAAPVVNGQRWNTYLAHFVHEKVLSTNLWDGVFYDNVFNDVSWVNGGDIDTDRNGLADNPTTVDQAWRDGMLTLMSTTRSLIGTSKIIIGNGGGQYYPEMNGRLIEEFPSHLDGGWTGAMQKYTDVLQRGLTPSIVVVNGKSTTGLPTDYQTMRYNLASTLLDNGFFSFDEGAVRHAAQWHFDEFNVYLGTPVNKAKRIWPSASTSYGLGVWRRDFQNGIALVNSTDQPRTIQLGDGYEELRGAPPSVNGGRVITSITLAGHDGRILLKRQLAIDAGGYTNGAFVQVFKETGTVTRSGFFSYNDQLPGGVAILMRDIDHDGHPETISAQGGTVTVKNYRNQWLGNFKPFGFSYYGDISLAAGDFNRDNIEDLVLSPLGQTSQYVVITTLAGRRLYGPWRPFKHNYPGGPSVAAADLNGDGRPEVIAAAGRGADPRVSVFSYNGRRHGTWLAYAKTFRGGVRVAAGQLVVGGPKEIVTIPASAGGPYVRRFSRSGRALAPGFFALPSSFRGTLMISIADIDHTGVNRIIVSTPNVY